MSPIVKHETFSEIERKKKKEGKKDGTASPHTISNKREVSFNPYFIYKCHRKIQLICKRKHTLMVQL